MIRKNVATPVVILLLLAGVAGYILLRSGDGTRDMRRITVRGVDEGMAVGRVNVEEELFSCPKCGGEGGFHVAFRRGTGKSERTLDVILVCPHCSFRFAVGDFHIPSGDPRPFDPSIDSGP